jgi:cold shock CspA family protein
MSSTTTTTDASPNTDAIEQPMVTTDIPDSRLIGCVKFFDKIAGFGFISVLKNTNFPQFSEKDIFFHYSAIHSEYENPRKYLLKGEYVEFKITPSNKARNNDKKVSNNEEIKLNAIDITGIQGGKLMCETNYTEFVPKRQHQTNYFNGGVTPNYYGKPSNGVSNGVASGVASGMASGMDVDVPNPPFTRRPSQPNYAGRINRRMSSYKTVLPIV